jgi:plasmid stabilization system protein ParE
LIEVIFEPLAEADAAGAQDWYEGEAPGLGLRFQTELLAAADRIALNPRIYRVVYRGVRKALLRHFPYELLFLLEPEAAHVIACFHSRRDPNDWQKRVS